MAKKTVVIDDISGDEIPDGQARNLVIGLDGQWYELDVSADTDARVREYIDECVTDARKIDAPTPPKAARPKRDYDVPTVRKWAKEQGFEVTQRGVLPEEVVAAWRADQATQGATAVPIKEVPAEPQDNAEDTRAAVLT